MYPNPLLEGLNEVRRNWGWFLVLGIALLILGIVALVAVGLTTLATMVFLGWLLIISGAFEAVAAFWARHWSGVCVKCGTARLPLSPSTCQVPWVLQVLPNRSKRDFEGG